MTSLMGGINSISHLFTCLGRLGERHYDVPKDKGTVHHLFMSTATPFSAKIIQQADSF